MEARERQGRVKHRKGQTLAEFAITLPILLLLLFGIIEFGRIFQAWVTLQNSARAAARYATTGNWNSDKYTMIEDPRIVDPTNPEDPDSVVPCVLTDERGTAMTYYPNGPGNPSVQIYRGGLESLYATWYQGEDCDPRLTSNVRKRIDMVRILSIFDEAYIGAAGLALAAQGTNLSPATFELPPIGTAYTTDTNFADDTFLNSIPWYEVWRRPIPGTSASPARYYYNSGYEERGFFDVMLCSGRNLMNQPTGFNRLAAYNTAGVEEWQRQFSQNSQNDIYHFVTILDSGNVDYGRTSVDGGWDLGFAPVCVVNEGAQSTGGRLSNKGAPWLDAGDQSDPITVVVTFNHPLVTPLGLSPYIQLQARRSAVNESFREADAVAAFPPLAEIPSGPVLTTPTQPGSVVDTPTPMDTSTPLPTATSTSSPTPVEPFTCAKVYIATTGGRPNVDMFGADVRVEIVNDNAQQTTLLNTVFYWYEAAAYPGMLPQNMKFLSVQYWNNTDALQTSPLETATQGQYINGVTTNLGPMSRGRWTATFVNGPVQLGDFLDVSAFNGTRFLFDNPITGEPDCELTFMFPTATEPPVGFNSPTPSSTPVPDCAPGLIEVNVVSFETLGVVRVDVTNRRNVVARMVGFNIQWIQRDQPTQALNLHQVWAGGNDWSGRTTMLWQHTNSGQDNAPPTIGSQGNFEPGSEGSWVSAYNFPPFETTRVWLKFEPGSGATLASAYGFMRGDFNGSRFIFLTPACGPGDGPGEPGYEDTTPFAIYTLTPSATRTIPPTVPTNTPTNTYTPSATFTPSDTPTTGPTPTATNTATQTFTPSPTLRDDGTGGTGGGG